MDMITLHTLARTAVGKLERKYTATAELCLTTSLITPPGGARYGLLWCTETLRDTAT